MNSNNGLVLKFAGIIKLRRKMTLTTPVLLTTPQTALVDAIENKACAFARLV